MDPSAAGGANAAAASGSTQRRASAPYGHACMGCSRAKSRCIGRTSDSPCERCHRLGKECQPSTVVRKGRSRRPRSPGPSKTAVLEQKLDNLVNLLASQGSLSTTPASTSSGVPHEQASQGQTPEDHDVAASSQQNARTTRHLTPSDDLTGAANTLWYLADPICRENQPAAASSEDEEVLETFKKYHLRSFPLIYFAPSVGYASSRCIAAQSPESLTRGQAFSD